MAWTIYRYILRELLKLLVLSTVVLVTVISFAAAIKPLSDGVGAGSLMKFIFYSAPTMLGFALPFAGAFASTLVFLRFAADNEIVACSASGMSYRAILLPVLGLGVALTMGLFLLSNFIVPDFYRRAAQSVENDLMTVLVTRLNENQPYVDERNRMVLYADTARERPVPHLDDSALQPVKMIQLTGVAVASIDPQGRVQTQATSRQANVFLFHDEGRSWITARMFEAMRYYPDRGEFGFISQFDAGPVRLPTPFRDSAKFLSWPELRQLRTQPQRYDRIRNARDDLMDAVSAERLRQLLAEKLAPAGEAHEVTLMEPGRGDRYTISTPRLQRGGQAMTLHAQGSQPVVVQTMADGRAGRRFEAASAELKIESGGSDPEPSVLLELRDVKVFDLRSADRFTQHSRYVLPRMVWPGAILDVQPGTLSVAQTMELAASPMFGQSRSVAKAGHQLYHEIAELARKIKAQLHQRAASAFACLLLLALGAILSMKLAGQMPLVVYFWTFLLAIVTLIIIYTGENMASSTNWPLAAGLGVIWLGNAGLCVVAAVIYCRLARN
jgi:lipopolysaccharide export LptBFGC system permease protein LptF